MEYEQALKARVEQVNRVIARCLPKEETESVTLRRAMNYSILAGGKRLRPLMIQCTGRMYGGREEILEPFMAGMEMVHTHSLIHDDLPCMDDDEYRRGRKTTHVVFGEGLAVLAGDALQNLGYETASKAFSFCSGPDLGADNGQLLRCARAMQIFTQKAGVGGMIGGQSVDVEYDGQPLTAEKLDYIFRLKTGALFEASLMIGAVLGGAPERDIRVLEKIGTLTGVAFQIRDDILDVTSTTEVLGKPAGSDEKNEKTTYVSLFGLKKSEEEVKRLSEEALGLFDTLEGRKHEADDEFLRELLVSLISRRR